MTSTATLTVRWATPADAAVLADLAALDSAAPLHGDVLVAEAAGATVAALSAADGRAVADPFTPTADVVDVLRVRALGLRPARRSGAVRGLLRLAPARLRPV
jgi:hypothetical protein